jgi:hypothetical protein
MLETLRLLIKIGLGTEQPCALPDEVNLKELRSLAERQGVAAICFDGLQRLTDEHLVDSKSLNRGMMLQWIGSTMRQEQVFNCQLAQAKKLAELWAQNGLDTLVMKGFSLSRLYPRPEHRPCSDMDCFLQWTGQTENRHEASERGNVLAEENGLKVDRSYYKNSKIVLKGLTVENHQYLLPVKGSGKAKKIERQLRSWIYDGSNDYIADTKLIATAPFFDAVYVLTHAQEHFLNEGISLRHVCDWAMVLKAHSSKVDWGEWKRVCKGYGLLSFGYAMSRLAKDMCGVIIPFECPANDEADKRLIEDILGCKEHDAGKSDLQTRFGLVKRMFQNKWKYKMFSETNAFMFCTRRVWGYLFDKDLD